MRNRKWSGSGLRTMTDEDLEKLQTELFDEEDTVESDEWVDYSVRIHLFKEKYRRAQKLPRTGLEKNELEEARSYLILYYIKYGGYLKTKYEKDDKMAVKYLREALKYDEILPIAYYRLGFLAYKKGNYGESVSCFQKAVGLTEQYPAINKDYRLNDQQKYFAYKYLMSSALHVVKSASEKEEQLRPDALKTEAVGYENLSLDSFLEKNDNSLEKQAFYKVMRQNGKVESQYCSQDDCWDIYEEMKSDALVLFFTDSTVLLKYQSKESVYLRLDEANKLRHLLLKSSSDNPATRETMNDWFGSRGPDGLVKKNTFSQSIRRIRMKLRDAGSPELIDTTNEGNETAYYFNEECPVAVLYRSDSGYSLIDEKKPR